MKILAIDIGTAHIKSVIVEAKFKRFDVVLHDTTSVPDAWDPISPEEQLLSPGQLSTLAEIQQRYSGGIDRIVTNLPFSLYSSRFQTFPLKDKRKVQAAVRFAIEDEIPFDLDDCIVTSHLFPTKVKETHVLTGFAPIPALERYIEIISSMGISPDCLMMEESALASQFFRSKDGPKTVAVLNLGHRKSGMFFFRNGLPVLHRNSMVAGFDLTQAISTRYSLGMAEAEIAKVERGFLAVPGMQLNPDQAAFSETIRGALEPVFSDFQQALMAFTSRYNEPLETIYICGGTALLPGLPEYLAQRWQRKVLPLQVTSLFPQFSIQPQKSVEWLLPTATALGLSQVSGEGRSQINFRSGKLHAASRGLQLNFQQFVYPAKLALSLYLVAILSVIGQTILLGRQRDAKNAQLDRSIQNVLGRVSTSFLASLKASPSRLKGEIEKKVEEFQSQAQGSGAPTGPSALDLIQELSRAVPTSVVTEIKVMDYQQNRISLTMESPSQDAAERAVSTLSQLPMFQDPKAGPLEIRGTRRRFTMNATLTPKGQ
jgi:general secretion pathway protein L